MVLPPLAAGYWLAGLGAFSVLSVFLAILKELCTSSSYQKKIDKDREALKGLRTPVPYEPEDLRLEKSKWTFKKSQFLAFTCLQNAYVDKENEENEERSLIRSFFEKIDIDVDSVIPRGARTVSYAFEGFEFGASCLDFRVKTQNGKVNENGVLTYQMMCSRVQSVYFNDQLAGVCLYFDIANVTDNTTDIEFNLMAFYDTVTRKTVEQVKETRKLEKKAMKSARCAEEPLKEYTSTIFSHLRLFTEDNGRTVVLARNADGKMEKYTFDERAERYEYVETEEGEEVAVGDDFLVSRY